MRRFAMVTAMIPVLAALAMAQDKPQAWRGNLESYEVGVFPGGSSKNKVHFGLIDQAKTWKKLWEDLGKDAPSVDFEKNVVLYVYYAKWPGSMSVGEPSVKDGVVTFDIGLDGAKPREEKKPEPQTPTPEGKLGSAASSEISFVKCHYEYEMRVQARAEIKTIRLTSGDGELGLLALKSK
jgi:hypothetical protein